MLTPIEIGRGLPADSWWPSLPLSLCFLWLLTLLSIRPTTACMETAWSQGFMTPESATLLDTITTTGSCHCCAMCHNQPSCHSLAVNDASGECRLYGTVASYATLTPDSRWKYFVIPGHSRLEQFCRTDADCVDGVPCRGRVCNTLGNITCRVIRDELGAGDRYGGLAMETKMYGWLDGRSLALACMFSAERPGYTRIFQNRVGFKFTRETIRNLNGDLSDGVGQQHSILYFAEDLRGLRSDVSTYHLVIESPGKVTIKLEVPRGEPVLASQLRVLPGVTYSHTGASVGPELSLPCLPPEGVTLLTVNGAGTKWYQLALAREDGSLNWQGELDHVYIYMLE